mgnify:CR=1 FL=1
MSTKSKRILALLLDLTIIGVIASVATNFFKFEWELGEYLLFNHHITWGLCDVFGNSVTIGKEVLKIRTISVSGKQLKLKNRIYRTLLKILSIIFWPISATVFLINGFTIEDGFCNTKTVEKQYHLLN